MKNHIKLYEEFNNTHHLLNGESEIQEWLDENYIDGTIEYDEELDMEVVDVLLYPPHNELGDANITNFHGKQIPVQFRKVMGNFDCGGTGLETLLGSPIKVRGSLYASHNQLETLYGIGSVKGVIDVSNNKLRTLIYLPITVSDIGEGYYYNTVSYANNPCTETYAKLGFGWDAHAMSLIKWFTEDPDRCLNFTNNLKTESPDIYKKIIESNPRVKEMLYQKTDDLKNAIKTSKDVEGDFY